MIPKNKKTEKMTKSKSYLATSAVAISVFVFFLFAIGTLPVYASSHIPPSPETSLGTVAEAFTAPAVAVTAGLLWVLKGVLSFLLTYIALALDNVIRWNVEFVPAAFSVVRLGWGVLRDIANSFFILILVWIALTIIFGIEQWGGKKLLFRVIVVALLINFSLAIVAAIFGFGNLFADVFYKKFPTQTTESGITVPNVSGYINAIISVETLFTPMSPEEAKRTAELQKQKAEEQYRQQNPLGRGITGKFRIAEALGIQEAQGIIFLVPILLFLGGAGAVTAAISFFLPGIISAAVGKIYTAAFQFGLIDVFLLITIAAFIIMTFMLLLRIIMMVILSILAPAVFFLYVIPGGFGEKYWKMWWTSVFRWAFFAPVFFFFFYISLFMLQVDVFSFGAGGAKVNAAASPEAFLKFIMAATMMIASVVVARKIAGGISDTAMGVATKLGGLGLAAATGGATALAVPLMRQARPMLEKGLEQVRQRPALAKVMSPVTGKVREHIEKQEDSVNKRTAQYAHMSPEHLAQEYAGVSSFDTDSAEKKVAIARALAEGGKFNKLNASEQENALRLAAQFGPRSSMSMLKARPDLAKKQFVPEAVSDEDAMNRVIDKMSVGEATKLSEEALTPEVMSRILQSFSPAHISEMQKQNPVATRKLMEHLKSETQKNPHFTYNMKSDTYRYLGSNAAYSLGLSLPSTDHMAPIELQKEEAGQFLADEERAVEQEAQKVQQDAQRAARAEEQAQTRYEGGVERRVEELQKLEDELQILGKRAESLKEEGRQREADLLSQTKIESLKAEIKRAQERLQ